LGLPPLRSEGCFLLFLFTWGRSHSAQISNPLLLRIPSNAIAALRFLQSAIISMPNTSHSTWLGTTDQFGVIILDHEASCYLIFLLFLAMYRVTLATWWKLMLAVRKILHTYPCQLPQNRTCESDVVLTSPPPL